jgi:thiol-disulfide isomerase/thioredoxin
MRAQQLFRLGLCWILAVACGSCSDGTASATRTVPTDDDAAKIGVKVGEIAPRLQPSGWVQGDPVKQLEPGKAYLVEFWATWCGPCRESIPHVDELHKKYKNKGLIVIGTDVGEDQQRVKEFIEKMADKMTYRVALDETNAMVTAWFAGADENPIPFAFLVDPQGKIAWKGFPLELDEKTIEKVLPGSQS